MEYALGEIQKIIRKYPGFEQLLRHIADKNYTEAAREAWRLNNDDEALDPQMLQELAMFFYHEPRKTTAQLFPYRLFWPVTLLLLSLARHYKQPDPCFKCGDTYDPFKGPCPTCGGL